MSLFSLIAVVALIVGVVSAAVIIVDILAGHPQRMAIMNAVWPINALYLGPIGLWAYWTMGRPMAMTQRRQEEMQHETGGHVTTMPQRGKMATGHGKVQVHGHGDKPFWQTVFVGVCHCGAGCTLGDVVAEFAVFFLGVTIARVAIRPELIGDYILAFALGILFQYFAIVPMRHLSPGKGIVAALKADALSLTAFEVGLFGWMLLTRFVFFRAAPLHPDEARYWFMMQIGMALGFLTSYPMNWWLIRRGIKEAM